MKTLRESFRREALKSANFEKEKVTPLTNEKQEIYQNKKICYIYKNDFEHK